LEASLAGVITSLSGDSHNVVSNAVRAYDRLDVKESYNIHANQQKIEEAQGQIKKSQLNIERAQKSLVDDIRSVVKSSNTDECELAPFM
jgi:peptidoglycan hydrolase CwlO-like protein